LYTKSKPYLFLSCALSLSLVTCGSTPVYTGSGGKGSSLAILAPKATGLTENQNYIPALVQGEFVSNFSGYSALSVMDRENLDNVYGELLSGYYRDTDEAGSDLGHLTSTDYLMNGSITKTATGYALQMQITKTADKMTAASYSGTCTFAELDNLTGVRRASLDLLQKMDIELTDRAKSELAGAATANHVNAQTALAQGITAQQSGTVVTALFYYYQAVAFDSSLPEAASRASVISAAISSGNIGENVRNDIQCRNEWLKLLADAEGYFGKHLPWEIVCNPALTQGKIDYVSETVDLSFNLEVRPTSGWKIVKNLIDGLVATRKRDEWGLTWWPLTSRVFTDGARSFRNGNERTFQKKINIEIDLINANGKSIASADADIFSEWWFFYIKGTGGSQYDYTKLRLSDKKFTINFKNVNANEITDNVTVKIVSVNGIDAETAGKTGYISIKGK
jgi:TolB-like protein